MSYANRYSATHRQWDHVENLFPNVEHSEKGPHGRLAGDFIPAPWLPVERYDKHFEAWSVVSPGKIVSLTRQAEAIKSAVSDWEDSQHVVPAGLKVLFAAGTGLTYTADDFTEQTIDLTTGDVYAVNGTTTYSAGTITTALIDRGLIETGETCDAFISYPLGVAAQAFWAWSNYNGEKFNALQRKQHNFSLQHQVQILVSYQLRLPYIPGVVATESVPGAITTTPPVLGTALLQDRASVIAMERWDNLSATGTWLAMFLDHYPLAGPTTLFAPLTESGTGVLTRLRSGPDALSVAGDYYVDAEAGVLFFYNASQTVIGANLTGTITYFSYDAAPAAVSIYASAVPVAGREIRNGDFLVCDADSNFAVEAGVGNATWSNFRVGQVFGFKTYPKDLMHRVKSQYTVLGNVNRMPGTATEGLPSTVMYAQGANKEVLVSLINR